MIFSDLLTKRRNKALAKAIRKHGGSQPKTCGNCRHVLITDVSQGAGRNTISTFMHCVHKNANPGYNPQCPYSRGHKYFCFEDSPCDCGGFQWEKKK